MEIFIIVILAIALLAMAAYIFSLANKKSQVPENPALAVLLDRVNILSEQNRQLGRIMDEKLHQTHEANRAQFSETARIIQSMGKESTKTIAEVAEKLAKLDETNRQVVNFSAQLQNLQDILKNPKQRGVLGEYFLEETLKNVLPPNSYEMQYKFKDGEIVDAAVFVRDKIIPVDSKFSLENYEKVLNSKDTETRERYEKLFKADLKNRIDETSKYIRPSENTMEFAFMFIPSEAIYYDLLVNKVGAVKLSTRDLIEYAFKDKRVIIVSPTSFLAYLQTVLQGLRAMQIEESAKSIRSNVEKLSTHLTAYQAYMEKLGGTLATTVNHYNNAAKEFKKIDKDVAKITDGETNIDLTLIDKPQAE